MTEPSAEIARPHVMDRATGSNQFVSADASLNDVVVEIARGLRYLRSYAEETGREIDLSAITVVTSPTKDGRLISVAVSGDLRASTDAGGRDA